MSTDCSVLHLVILCLSADRHQKCQEPSKGAVETQGEEQFIIMHNDKYGDAKNDDVDEERPILSEVHIGKQSDSGDNVECHQVCGATMTTTTVTNEVLVSRYRYHTPPLPASTASNAIAAAPPTQVHRNTDSNNSDDSSSEGETPDDDGYSVVARHRRRSYKRPRVNTKQSPRLQLHQTTSTPRYEVLTIVHKMATPLDLVGQQVWCASFLLGDFVLTHGERFAGAQVWRECCDPLLCRYSWLSLDVLDSCLFRRLYKITPLMTYSGGKRLRFDFGGVDIYRTPGPGDTGYLQGGGNGEGGGDSMHESCVGYTKPLLLPVALV